MEELLTSGKFIKKAIIVYGTIGSGLFTIIQLVGYFFNNNSPYDKLSTVDKIIIFLGVTAFIGSIYLVSVLWKKYLELSKKYKEVFEKNEPNSENLSEDSLVVILNTAYKAEHWKEVVKIGSQLSSPLWYTGKLETRVKIGELVESAAAISGDYYIQAETLLDDLGWTKFRLKKIKDAKNNIKRGLAVAQKYSYNYLIAKGYRHLADIHLADACSLWTIRYLDMGNEPLPTNLNESELKHFTANYDLALQAAKKIENESKKTEMLGNLQYTFAKYKLVIREYDDAISAVDKSFNYYANNHDLERAVKLYNLKGKIQLMSGNENNAIETFQLGIHKFYEIANNIHVVTNSLSLAEYYLREDNYSLSRRMLKTAVNNIQYISDPVLNRRCEEIQLQLNIKGGLSNE